MTKRSLLTPASAPTHVKKGYAFSLLGIRHSAISQYNRALQLDPSYALARQALAIYGGDGVSVRSQAILVQ